MSEIQVVNSKTFSEASARLPKETRAKIQKTLAGFFNSAVSLTGMHQEPIHVEDDMYSARVDDNYRIIYKRPAENKNLVFLLYVGKHDEAYSWAKKHCVSVNIGTGGIQIAGMLSPKTVKEGGKTKLNPRLAALNAQQMLELQIPSEYWEQLRTKIYTIAQLQGYISLLPEETYTILEEIINGMPVDEAMEIYGELTSPITVPAINNEGKKEPFFVHVTDDDLISVGIPANYLKLVKNIRTDAEFNSIAAQIPEDAAQSLYAIRSGESIASILKTTYDDSNTVASDDFSKALDNPITKTQFVTIEDEEALKAILEYPAEQWRIFLHPSQRRLVERHYAGPARIIGGAGTGKTVVIVHRAKFLAQDCSDNEKVLVTSFNKTLVADIQERLKTICSSSELDRITVATVDKLAYDITLTSGLRIEYNEINDYWNEALEHAEVTVRYDADFYKDEWRDVIQAQQIVSLEQYLSAQRLSRGKRLDRHAREEVWKVIAQFEEICKNNKKVDIDKAENMCVGICEKNPALRRYRHILIDECQDLRAPAYRMIRALSGPQHQDDIYFSGDSRQRIYKGQASLSQCGIFINNRSSVLKLNYRTTTEIYESAMRIQQGYQYDDLDGKAVDQDQCVCISHGEKPKVRAFNSKQEELNQLANDIRSQVAHGIVPNEICVLARSNKRAYDLYNQLNLLGFNVLLLTNKQPDDKSIPGIRVATMHRVKGMEFNCVYIPNTTNDSIPPKEDIVRIEDEEERNSLLKQEANLLSVAMTRAKRYVWISYTGEPSEYLKNI